MVALNSAGGTGTSPVATAWYAIPTVCFLPMIPTGVSALPSLSLTCDPEFIAIPVGYVATTKDSARTPLLTICPSPSTSEMVMVSEVTVPLLRDLASGTILIFAAMDARCGPYPAAPVSLFPAFPLVSSNEGGKAWFE